MAKKKKPAPAPTVQSILAECEKQVKSGLGKKRLSKQARKFWTDEYTASITKQLAAPGSNWLSDRKRVLPVAKKLGKVAAALATGKIVLLWAADAASVAVKSDPGCPTAGTGGYCDI